MTDCTWLRVSTAAGEAPAESTIHIIDVIGDWYDDAANRVNDQPVGLTARAFIDALGALPDSVKTLHVRINSPGGDVQAGIQIANALRGEQGKGRAVVTYIDGVAASIASVIAMAGQQVVIAENGLLMIHDPVTIAVGNAGELSKALEFLGAVKDQMVATYKWHATAPETEIRALMTAETWMDADRALALGFATMKATPLKAQATLSRSAVAKLRVPPEHRAAIDALVARQEPPAPAPGGFDALAVVTACAQAGVPELTAELVTARASLGQATARISEERQRRAAAAARAEDIRAVCAMAQLPELADGYINGGMSLAGVRAQMVVMRAKLDAVEIDGSLVPSRSPSQVRASWDKAFAGLANRGYSG